MTRVVFHFVTTFLSYFESVSYTHLVCIRDRFIIASSFRGEDDNIDIHFFHSWGSFAKWSKGEISVYSAQFILAIICLPMRMDSNNFILYPVVWEKGASIICAFLINSFIFSTSGDGKSFILELFLIFEINSLPGFFPAINNG